MSEDRTPPSLRSPPSASRTLLHFNYLIVANQPPPTGAPAHTQRNANVTTMEQQAVNGTPSLTRSMIRARRPILSISTLFDSGCPGSSVANAVGVSVQSVYGFGAGSQKRAGGGEGMVQVHASTIADAIPMIQAVLLGKSVGLHMLAISGRSGGGGARSERCCGYEAYLSWRKARDVFWDFLIGFSLCGSGCETSFR